MRRPSRYSLTIPRTAHHIRLRRTGHAPAWQARDHTHLGAHMRPDRHARRGSAWRVTHARPRERPGHLHSAAAPHTPLSNRRIRHHRRALPASHRYTQVVRSLPSHAADSHHSPNSRMASGHARRQPAPTGVLNRPGSVHASLAARVDHRADLRGPPMVDHPGPDHRGGAEASSAILHGGRPSPRSRRLAPRRARRANVLAIRAHLPSQAPRLAGRHRSRMTRDRRSGCSPHRSFARAGGCLWRDAMGDARGRRARRSRHAAGNRRAAGGSVECAGAGTPHPCQALHLARKRLIAAEAACPVNRGDAAGRPSRPSRLQEWTAQPGYRRQRNPRQLRRWRSPRHPHRQEYSSAAAGSCHLRRCLALSTARRNSDTAPFRAASRLRTACTAYVPSTRQGSAILAPGHKGLAANHNPAFTIHCQCGARL
jgi:hypothetical protein